MAIEQRTKIPEHVYLVVRNMGTSLQRTQWYHSLTFARRRKTSTGGRLFELPTSAMKEIE